MGKASSAKKVARAARAGGSRRPGQRRELGFPLVIAVVVLLGVALVVYARSTREALAEPRSQATDEPDHWHAAYGIAKCGDFVFDTEATYLTDAGPDALGIHTHADGVIHVHPFTDSAAGRNARMRLFFDQVGIDVSDSKVTFPDGTTWDESKDTCTVDGEEVRAQIVLAKWNDVQDAVDGEKPNDIRTEDLGDVRFTADGEYYTLALVPEGQLEDIPVRPGILDALRNLTDVIEAPETPGSTTTTAGEGEGDGSTTTTAAGGEGEGSTTTTVADSTTTTAAG